MWIRRLRWWHVVLVTALAVVGIVPAASWVILRVYGPAFTRERVEALLSEALGQPARVGAVHLRPWRGRISLVDLHVLPRATPPDGVLLRAPTIDVSVDIASLWRRELTLSLLATDLDLDMTAPPMKARRARHLSAAPVRGDRAAPRRHRKRAAQGGHAVIRGPEAAWTVEVAGADVTARPAAGDLDVSGRLDTLRVERARPPRAHRAGRRRRPARGRPAPHPADRLALEGEAMHLDGEMRRPWLASREVSLRLKGVIGLGALAKAAGLDQRIDGKAQIGADITGPAAAPRIAARRPDPRATPRRGHGSGRHHRG